VYVCTSATADSLLLPQVGLAEVPTTNCVSTQLFAQGRASRSEHAAAAEEDCAFVAQVKVESSWLVLGQADEDNDEKGSRDLVEISPLPVFGCGGIAEAEEEEEADSNEGEEEEEEEEEEEGVCVLSRRRVFPPSIASSLLLVSPPPQ
jgi:hypothetical protein